MDVLPMPAHEAERLRVLTALELLDTAREEVFERVVTAACAAFGVPMAAVSLVDERRQWFKASRGLGACQTAREVAFCAHTIMGDESMVVRDAAGDARFVANPLVTGGPALRFYAGAPLRVGGHNIGTLCVMDTQPREFAQGERGLLADLAGVVAWACEQRLATARQEAVARARLAAVSGMSHQMRAPLTALIGFAELLREQPCECQEHAMHAETVARNAEHVLKVAERFEQSVHAPGLQAGLVWACCRVDRIVSEVCQTLIGEARQAGLELEPSWGHLLAGGAAGDGGGGGGDGGGGASRDGAATGMIVADEFRVRQGLLNMLGDVLRLCRGRGTARVHGWARPSGAGRVEVRIGVRVPGPGLDAAGLARMIEVAEADPGEASARFGVGLGLSMARRQARLMGGDVTYTPPEAGGAAGADGGGVGDGGGADGGEFELVFYGRPAESATPSQPDAHEQRPEASAAGVLRGRRVLVVDDSQMSVRLLARYLRQAGAMVESVATGEEAVKRLGQGPSRGVDCVLMDIELPGIDGLEAGRRSRAAGYAGPMVIVTGRAEAHRQALASVVPDCQCLSKPVDRDRLIGAVRAAIGGADAVEGASGGAAGVAGAAGSAAAA
ncbi:MAG: hypothetical protein C0475_08185 [Planctomyces sp.]|nr:hypothetical protein [Planctomyces sp.]MBA4119897.1 hypothetical protein [Isosphaera sp.]